MTDFDHLMFIFVLKNKLLHMFCFVFCLLNIYSIDFDLPWIEHLSSDFNCVFFSDGQWTPLNALQSWNRWFNAMHATKFVFRTQQSRHRR